MLRNIHVLQMTKTTWSSERKFPVNTYNLFNSLRLFLESSAALSKVIIVFNERCKQTKKEHARPSCNEWAYVCSCIAACDSINEIKPGVNRHDQTVSNLTGSFITQLRRQIPSSSQPAAQLVPGRCTDWNIKVFFSAGVQVFFIPFLLLLQAQKVNLKQTHSVNL